MPVQNCNYTKHWSSLLKLAVRYISSYISLYPFILAVTLLSSVKGECRASGISITRSNGTFYSPHYPYNYPNSVTCRWVITVPKGYMVRLKFQFFRLKSCFLPSSSCNCDYLEVRDGSHEYSKLLGKYCGDEYPTSVQSSGRDMWIEFYSDMHGTDKGFWVTYIAVGMYSLLLFSITNWVSKLDCLPE